MNAKPRVFHILDENEPFSEFQGGAISRWVANVLRRDERSIAVCVSTDGSWKVSAGQVRTPRGYRALSRLVQRAKVPVEARSLLAARIFERGLRDLSPGDVMWIHNRPEYCRALTKFARAKQARVVLHLHNSILEWKRTRLLETLQLDRTVFVSEHLRRVTTERFSSLRTSSVIYNGSDDALFYPGPPRNRTEEGLSIVFASRLVPEKGAHVLVDAVEQLTRRKIPVVLKIIGSTGFGKNTRSAYIEKLQEHASPQVQFLGYRSSSEVALLLRQADVFCLPSIWDDPFPLAPLEAMASGVAVVASRSGGIPEAFRWGGAILVDKNSSTQLADALETLVREPQRVQQLSQEGLSSFREHFTWPHVIDQFRNVVDGL